MKSDLPFASEFSPSIIDLRQLLSLAAANQGNRLGLDQAIQAKWFDRPTTAEAQRPKLAGNVRLGLQSYGIIDKGLNLTKFGENLVNTDTDESAYEHLARHILLNLRGSVFVETIRDMQGMGDQITLNTLRQSLADRGIHTSPANKSMSVMRLWLERAGVFRSGYDIDIARYELLLGAMSDEIRVLARLPGPQRAYLRALAALADSGSTPANATAVRELAEKAFAGKFDEKQLPKQVLYPLADAGLIRWQRTGGRGKPFLVETTESFRAELFEPLLKQFALKVSPEVLEMVRQPLKKIADELSSEDRHVKGLALEAFAFRLMWSIGLRHQGTRLSGIQTGGAEVDLVFDSVLLEYSRWQIQCKNTGYVSLDDVAKEVGVAQYLMSNAIAVVSTGKISRSARGYARHMMATSNLAIILLDEDDIASILIEPTSILAILEREARAAFDLKPLRLD